MEIYVVEAGDTLGRIGASFGVEPALLARENGLDLEQTLVVGQALVIAKPQLVYRVRPGDTLYGLARQFGTTVRQIWRNNPWLESRYILYPDQPLILRYRDAGGPEFFINGYAYPGVDQNILGQSLACANTVGVFAYGFDAQGNLLRPSLGTLPDRVRQAGTGLMLVLASVDETGAFDSQRTTDVLQSPEKRQRLVDQVVEEVLRQSMAGVDLDFEYVRAEDGPAYVQFAQDLHQALAEQGLRLTVALAPKTSADQPGLLYEGHDYRALGAAADGVTLMTYEWGYTYGPPMAVAPLPEVERVARYGITEIPPAKILLGMANYGYDWTLPYQPNRAARSIGNQQAVDLARQYGVEIQFDPDSQTPYFFYRTPAGEEHVVWFEDARSVSGKMALAAGLGLGGLSYWTLTRPFLQNWMVLATAYTLRP